MSLLKSVATLATGTVLGHAITAAALPILTRLYTPHDFSVLAVFSSMVAMVSVVACLRFEIAIPLPEDYQEAVSLLLLAFFSAVVGAAVCALVAWLAPDTLASLIRRPDVRPYFGLFPVAVLLTGIYAALQCWQIRQKAFASVAHSRIVQSSAAAGTQLGFAMLGGASTGLVAGYLANPGAGALMLAWKSVQDRDFLRAIRSTGMRSLRATWRAYDRFPKYSTWEALANSAAIQLPVLMIAALAAPTESGHLLLAMTIIQAPMSLIGGAIGQVYLSHAADEHRRENLAGFTVDVLGRLNRVGVGPLLALGIAAPVFFPIVFGVNWARAGELVAWMTPWFALQFLASPVSMALQVAGRQRMALGLQVISLIVRVASVVIAMRLFSGTGMSEAYALSGAVVYALYLFAVLWCVHADFIAFRDRMRQGAKIISAWCLGSVTIALLIWWVQH